MHQTLDQTDSGLGFARIVVSEIEARSILVIRSEFIVNLARRGQKAVRNDNSPYRHPLDAAWVLGGQEGPAWQGRTPVLVMPRWGLSVSGSELIGRASESERDERETDTESGRETARGTERDRGVRAHPQVHCKFWILNQTGPSCLLQLRTDQATQ
jgi:hypothetical protein